MKLAVLGGSFDPPHIGHYLVLQQILELRKDIDTILLMPVYQHQWKPCFATPKERLEMLTSLIQPRVAISNIEILRKTISYTIDTLKELRQQTQSNIYWIIGSDIIKEFHRWEKNEKLTNLATFLVFPRDPHLIPKKIPEGFEVIKDKKLITTNISSTAIRQRIKQNLPITHLVLPQVEQYISKHNLYK